MTAAGTDKAITGEHCGTWRDFHAWTYNRYWKRLKVVVVMSNRFVPYLEYERHKTGIRFVALDTYERVFGFEFDRRLSAHDVGWGVDTEQYDSVVNTRPWSRSPVFFFANGMNDLANDIVALGYDVTDQMVLGNVAVIQDAEVVPMNIYAAAAAGMAVVTTERNARWLDAVVDFGVYTEDGAAGIVKAVAGADYKFAGMMSRDIVPSMDDFENRFKNLLMF